MLERIEQVLDEQVRPYLQGHGGAVEVRELTEDGLLRVRLLGHCAGCPSATITTEQIIQEAVCAAIPEVRQVVLSRRSTRTFWRRPGPSSGAAHPPTAGNEGTAAGGRSGRARAFSQGGRRPPGLEPTWSGLDKRRIK